MSETVSKTDVKYDTDYIYYLKGGDVWGSPRKKPGQTTKGKAQKFVAININRDNAYMYFVKRDKNDNIVVERAQRQVGGTKRKKTAKAAPKKTAKKPAKKPAKKAPAKKAGGKKGKKR